MFKKEEKFVDVQNYDYSPFTDDPDYYKCENCGKIHETSYITGMNLEECDEIQLLGEDVEIPDGRGNRDRWKEVVNETRKCPYCPKHGGENVSRKSRDDKYKDSRKK